MQVYDDEKLKKGENPELRVGDKVVPTENARSHKIPNRAERETDNFHGEVVDIILQVYRSGEVEMVKRIGVKWIKHKSREVETKYLKPTEIKKKNVWFCYFCGDPVENLTEIAPMALKKSEVDELIPEFKEEVREKIDLDEYSEDDDIIDLGFIWRGTCCAKSEGQKRAIRDY